MRKKILIIIFALVVVFLGCGITYSVFTSDTHANFNQNLAKFVFDAKETDQINLPLYDLKPGDIKEYKFSVSNNKNENDKIISSDVNINYQLLVSTYHFMPLEIEIFKLDNDSENSVLKCDESYSRNSDNELVCKSVIEEMKYDINSLDNYLIRVKFPSEYDSYEYSNLVDYIELEIKSWQKVGES